MTSNALDAAALGHERTYPPLRRLLLIDAIGSGASALLAMAASDWLSAYLGLAPALLRGAGVVLVPFVALLALAVVMPRAPRALVGIIITLNVLWVLASLGLLVTGRASPTGFGIVFVLVQAGAVALLAWGQCTRLKRR